MRRYRALERAIRWTWHVWQRRYDPYVRGVAMREWRRVWSG